MAPVDPTDLLLLFDIDGTLVRGATEAHREAVHRALHEVHGLAEIDLERTAHIDPGGRTDGEIARLILLAHDVSAERIDARAEDVRIACCETYARLCPPDLSETVLPGVPELLERLAARDGVHLTLLTGNYEAVARIKLKAAGIGRWFEPRQGAFGSDSEDRTDLPAIARWRAANPDRELPQAMRGADALEWNSQGEAPHPRDRTVVIGDTPRDIACARADEIRCLAVATGRHSAEALTAADAVVGDTTELARLIDDLR